ncbi:polysaccharide deacetylase family protein [Fictibacillus enclensis]|uniref:polysaccharide deacetylase family protein n=1 Tax=Fictibacillus enclensis TaxID=1017270 RepID=UPI0025A1842A|nr:polysaccharide deacetylase family protein [Fictibacillus enclensis]MDM5339734.1 polysaccharide deacetylase family protein [Fictibacillus enclensis]
MKKLSTILGICLAGQLMVNPSAMAASYTVQSGDTLKEISEKNHTSEERMANLNKLFSTKLAKGQYLEIPNPTSHKVKKGDTLWKLSVKYGVTSSKMKEANPQIDNYQMIYPGQTVNVPIKKETGYYMGRTDQKQIALTFDDGPDNHYTPQILKILKDKGVKATFFVMGERAKKYPEQLKQISREGHAIGNHTWDHPNITKLTDQELEKTVESTSTEIEKTTGKKTHLFRPPYGEMNDHQLDLLNSHYQSIMWTADTKDWDGKSAEDIISAVTENASPGVIVLQHSYHEQGKFETVKALPKMIDQLRAKGYKFVTVPTLINEK